MENYSYNDGLCPGNRRPRLYLVKGSEYVKFEGENIAKFCAISSNEFKKNGKWSSSTYSITLAPGVRPLYFLSRLHGIWGDDLKSWGEVVEELQLPIEQCKELIGKEYPTTAKRLNELEQFAMEIEESKGSNTELVIINFGSPTNRQIQNGYWSDPKSGITANGNNVIVKPGAGEYGPDWYKAELVEPNEGKIVNVKHTPGMHGGYFKIEVAVPLS